jgi:lipid-A-disaccharide synthase
MVLGARCSVLGSDRAAPGSRLPAPGSETGTDGTGPVASKLGAGSREPGAALSEPSTEHRALSTEHHPERLELAVFAGELSGDLQGAALVRAVRELRPEIRFWGMGGQHMRAAGVELAFDSTRWGAMGIFESLKLAPRLLWVLGRIRGKLVARSPGGVVLIDYGAFNARVGAFARRRGMPVFYYFPPGSWQRGMRPAERLAQFVDAAATPFPWSAENLRAVGVDAHFVGHPLLDLARPARNREQFCRDHGLDPCRPTVCYLPGSRLHEVRYNWPAMREAARLISAQKPGTQHVVVQATSVAGVGRWALGVGRWALGVGDDDGRPNTDDGPQVTASSPTPNAQRLTPDRLVVTSSVYDALGASDVAVTKSGTVTLEAAILGVPMVILYRGSWIQELEYRLWHRKRIKFIGMPNILAERRICPELIQEQASPEALASAALEWLNDPERAAETRRELAAVTALLGQPGAIQRTARLILSWAAPSTAAATPPG